MWSLDSFVVGAFNKRHCLKKKKDINKKENTNSRANRNQPTTEHSFFGAYKTAKNYKNKLGNEDPGTNNIMRTIHKNAHKDLSLCCELVVVQCGTIYASFVKPWCFAHKQFVLNEQVSVIWHDQEQPSASCGISAFYKWPSLLLVYGKAITGLIFVTDLSSSIKLLFNLNSCSTH